MSKYDQNDKNSFHAIDGHISVFSFHDFAPISSEFLVPSPQ